MLAALILVVVLLAGRDVWTESVHRGLTALYAGRFEQADKAFMELVRNFRALDLRPEQAAMLFRYLGDLRVAEGNYTEAEDLYWKAVKALPPDSSAYRFQTAAALRDLAVLSLIRARYEDAEQQATTALSLMKAAAVGETAAVGGCLDTLAEVYRARGKRAQAGPLYQQALRICDRYPDWSRPDWAAVLNHLAEWHFDQGQFAQGETFCREALAVSEKVMGKKCPMAATSLHNLGRSLLGQSKLGEAEPLLSRTLALRERVLGSDHPDVAESLRWVAELGLARGDRASAEPMLQRALRILERSLGREHPRRATILRLLDSK
jgi:tetratricopeptide (TPR) repeat protein